MGGLNFQKHDKGRTLPVNRASNVVIARDCSKESKYGSQSVPKSRLQRRSTLENKLIMPRMETL